MATTKESTGHGGVMKAAVVEKPGTLVIKQVPVPAIDENEVLIKVKYTGICGTDWSIFTGKYSADKLPLIPGHEFSGTVAQAGKRAKGVKEGDRVTADINMACGTCLITNVPGFSTTAAFIVLAIVSSLAYWNSTSCLPS